MFSLKNKIHRYSIILFGFLLFLLSSITLFAVASANNQEILVNTNFVKKDIWGEDAKLMFPDIDNATFVDVPVAANFLRDEDVLFSLKINGTTYAFPQNILSYHHVASFKSGSRKIAMTYCLLADAAQAYDSSINGTPISIGVLGSLLYGDAILYDKADDAKILQLTGQIFSGKENGFRLNRVAKVERKIWSELRTTANLKILPPLKEIAFYRDFYDNRKDSAVGTQSILTKNIPVDKRASPLQKGLGLVIKGQSYFIPIDIPPKSNTATSLAKLKIGHQTYIVERNFKASTMNISTGTMLPVNSIQVYWYTWSTFFPNTQIISAP